MENQISYHRQKPEVVRSDYLTYENDDETYLYMICFQQAEMMVKGDGYVMMGQGIMFDYFGHATFVSVQMDYWEEIRPEEFFLSCPNMLGKAKIERDNRLIKTLSN